MVNWIRGFWANSLRYNWPSYLIVLAAFSMGLAAGFLGVEKLQVEQVHELVQYLDRFLQQAGMIEVDTNKAFWDVIYNDIFVILAVYLLGLTVIGIPVMLGIVFTRGFVLGFTICFLAKGKGIQGVILACAAVLPQNIILVPALLLGGVASLSFALLLARRFFNSKVLVWPSFVLYSFLMVLVMVFTAGSGFIEVFVTPVLIKLTVNLVIS